MLVVVVFALILLNVLAGTTETRDGDSVVGARLELSDRCRLGQLPGLSTFVAEVAPNFGALRVVDDAAVEPRLVFLNKFQQELASFQQLGLLSGEEIVDVLAANGVFPWSPVPDYAAQPIEPSEDCIAWRQTGNCSGSSALREPLGDEHCSIRIGFDRSGFCECSAELSVTMDCDHDEASCDQMCTHARSSGR
jgi:hypothetical protein